MTVAPIDNGSELAVGSELYERALEDQRQGRTRILRIVPEEHSDEGLNVVVGGIEHEQVHTAMAALLAGVLPMLLGDETGHRVLRAAFESLPFARFLPPAETDAMIREAVAEFNGRKVSAAEIEQFFVQWQHTAEIYADPDLYAALSQPLQFDGESLQSPGEES